MGSNPGLPEAFLHLVSPTNALLPNKRVRPTRAPGGGFDQDGLCGRTRRLTRWALYGFEAAFVRLCQERSPLMTENILGKLFEHNNWANLRIIQACSALSDEQLDAEPQSATKGSIRHTLVHLVASQQGYLSLLTLPVEERLHATLAFTELQQAASISGEGLLSLGGHGSGH